MQHKPFDTPILCIFNLYSRNNDEYGWNNTFSFDLAYLQKYIVRCYGNTHVLIFSEYEYNFLLAEHYIDGTFSLTNYKKILECSFYLKKENDVLINKKLFSLQNFLCKISAYPVGHRTKLRNILLYI